MFYEQLKKACSRSNISLTALLRQLNLSSANTGKWKNGGYPSVDILLKIATELNVSTDYLLTGKENNFKNEKENEGMNKNSLDTEILNEGIDSYFEIMNDPSTNFYDEYGRLNSHWEKRTGIHLGKLKKFKEKSATPTYHEFESMLAANSKAQNNEKCKALLNELYDKDVFDEPEAEKLERMEKRLHLIEKLLMSKFDDANNYFNSPAAGE